MDDHYCEKSQILCIGLFVNNCEPSQILCNCEASEILCMSVFENNCETSQILCIGLFDDMFCICFRYVLDMFWICFGNGGGGEGLRVELERSFYILGVNFNELARGRQLYDVFLRWTC